MGLLCHIICPLYLNACLQDARKTNIIKELFNF